jgi:hypothetical protein
MKVNHKNLFPGNNSLFQPRRALTLRARKPRTLTAAINTIKVNQGFAVTVSLFSGRNRITGDFLQLKDCLNEARAWLAGYNHAQALADKHAPRARLYVQGQSVTSEGARRMSTSRSTTFGRRFVPRPALSIAIRRFQNRLLINAYCLGILSESFLRQQFNDLNLRSL